MNLEKLKPWNWFKHEERQASADTIPVRRQDYEQQTALQDPLQDFHREIDRLFDGFFGSSALPRARFGALSRFSPEINVAAEEDEYLITVEAAGLDDKDIQLEVNDHTLLIRGNKQEESEKKERHYYHMERRYGSFQRVLALPEDADENRISASMKKGVLTIRIGKRALVDSDARRIEIEH